MILVMRQKEICDIINAKYKRDLYNLFIHLKRFNYHSSQHLFPSLFKLNILTNLKFMICSSYIFMKKY